MTASVVALPAAPVSAALHEESTTGVRIVPVPGLANGYANDINELGAVVGSGARVDLAAVGGQSNDAGFHWGGPGRGEATRITPNFESGGLIERGWANAVNDTNEVVGAYQLPSGLQVGDRAFYWNEATGLEILTMPPGVNTTNRDRDATGIDDQGRLVGNWRMDLGPLFR